VWAIDYWMSGVFHAVGLLDPRLTRSGYGSFYDPQVIGFAWAAGIDVLRGRHTEAETGYPVMYPGDGTVSPLYGYPGAENPDPLTACPGYDAPAGAPIFLLLGDGSTVPVVTASSLSENGRVVPHCVFDETDYVNPSPTAQQTGRAVLDARDAVVVIPREPLIPGARYSVSITAGGRTHEWSFTTYLGTIPRCDGRVATIVGDDSDDDLRGTWGDDVIWAGGGNDRVEGLGGDDTICLGGGDDWVHGGRGDDRVIGGSGADTILGGPGGDTLLGGDGDDTLRGGDGDDLLDGATGFDHLFGGVGSDECRDGETVHWC
jgi:hypothetical protein